MTIETITLDEAGAEVDRREFNTVKEARAWVKTCGLDAAYWARRSESETWASENVYEIHLHKDGELVEDWYAGFTSAQP